MLLIGIAGGSGSGKTTFAHKVKDRAGPNSIGVLHLDSYYLDRIPAHLHAGDTPNYDHPEAFDWKLLKQHLNALKAGKRVQVPVYDYTTSRREKKTVSVGPCSAVLMEGIFTLWNEEIREIFDLTIYLHVDADIRFIRRLHRDVRERQRSIDGIIRQYYDTVRPMHMSFLEPTGRLADMIIGEETDKGADVVAAYVAQVLRRPGGKR